MSDSKVLGFLKQSCTGMTTAELRAKCEREEVKNWLAELKQLKDNGLVRVDRKFLRPALLKATPQAFV